MPRTLRPRPIAPSVRSYNLWLLLYLAEPRDGSYRGAVLRSWQLSVSVLDLESRGEDEDLSGVRTSVARSYVAPGTPSKCCFDPMESIDAAMGAMDYWRSVM
jgi:hypothetical protein